MRAWKGAVRDVDKVFLYFRDHTEKLFTEDHVAAQVKVGRRRTRKIVAWLVIEDKLETIDTVSSLSWGRPKKMFRSIRSTDDDLDQLEIFRDKIAAAGFEDARG